MARLSPYDLAYRRQMDHYHPRLWAQLDGVPLLEPGVGAQVVSFLLELACQSQHMRNIELGREALQAIPRDWLMAHLEQAAEHLLHLNEEWEYRRLLELYWGLDRELTRRLATQGLESANPDIRLAGQEFLDKLVVRQG